MTVDFQDLYSTVHPSQHFRKAIQVNKILSLKGENIYSIFPFILKEKYECQVTGFLFFWTIIFCCKYAFSIVNFLYLMAKVHANTDITINPSSRNAKVDSATVWIQKIYSISTFSKFTVLLNVQLASWNYVVVLINIQYTPMNSGVWPVNKRTLFSNAKTEKWLMVCQPNTPLMVVNSKCRSLGWYASGIAKRWKLI